MQRYRISCCTGIMAILLATVAYAQDGPLMPDTPPQALPVLPAVRLPATATPVPPLPAPVSAPPMALPPVAAPSAVAPEPAASSPDSVSSPIPDPVPAPVPAPVSGAVPSSASSPAPVLPQLPGGQDALNLNTGAAESEFSYGAYPYSLMFTPMQVEAMKAALTSYETMRRNGVSTEILVEEQILAPAASVIDEPDYPVFTLSSVFYRNGGDWSVWLGSRRITPRTNIGELRVVAISPNLVRFIWQPEAMVALRQRARLGKFAATAPVAHKLTTPNRVEFTPESDAVYFTLRPNQSFSAGYMATFEGRVSPPLLEPITDTPAEADSREPSAGGVGPKQVPLSGLAAEAIRDMYDRESAPAPMHETVDELMRVNKNIQAITPRPRTAGGQVAPAATPLEER